MPRAIQTILDAIEDDGKQNHIVLTEEMKNFIIGYFQDAIAQIDLLIEALELTRKSNGEKDFSDDEQKKILGLNFAKKQFERQINIIRLSYELMKGEKHG